MRIKLPDFNEQIEMYMRKLDEANKVPYPISRAYFILRALKEDVGFLPTMYRVHLDELPVNRIFYQDLSEWIEEWRDMWPTQKEMEEKYGIRLTYDIKCSKKAVERKMNSFIKDFYSKFSTRVGKMKLHDKQDLITKATKLYLSECAENNWHYTKKSMYFIEKESDSLLEKYIWRILDGELASEAKGNNFYIS